MNFFPIQLLIQIISFARESRGSSSRKSVINSATGKRKSRFEQDAPSPKHVSVKKSILVHTVGNEAAMISMEEKDIEMKGLLEVGFHGGKGYRDEETLVFTTLYHPYFLPRTENVVNNWRPWFPL